MNRIKDIYDPLLPTLLISIHKEYVVQIVAGIKIIEYRKKFYPEAFQAFIYTTGKGGGIEAFVKFDAPIINDAQTLSLIGKKIQNDNENEIFAYFEENNSGYIIPIEKVYQLERIPLKILRDTFPKFTVPQKYLFLDRPEKQSLLEFLLNKSYIKYVKNEWNTYYQQIKDIINGI
ncbi:hypothetical protein [Fructilactobacillus frigidiflavus]|uniref:hypothetical protein n=1 Tax=Fructilactobacillus frigidiflavus TaxID=3242688 RepID=UPI003757629E